MRTDDLLIPQGSTWEMHWPIVDASGNPSDLTGYSARSQVRSTMDSSNILYEFAASVSGSDVVLRVEAEDSSAWTWARGVYDIEMYNDTSVVRITQGTIKVSREVTR